MSELVRLPPNVLKALTDVAKPLPKDKSSPAVRRNDAVGDELEAMLAWVRQGVRLGMLDEDAVREKLSELVRPPGAAPERSPSEESAASFREVAVPRL